MALRVACPPSMIIAIESSRSKCQTISGAPNIIRRLPGCNRQPSPARTFSPCAGCHLSHQCPHTIIYMDSWFYPKINLRVNRVQEAPTGHPNELEMKYSSITSQSLVRRIVGVGPDTWYDLINGIPDPIKATFRRPVCHSSGRHHPVLPHRCLAYEVHKIVTP